MAIYIIFPCPILQLGVSANISKLLAAVAKAIVYLFMSGGTNLSLGLDSLYLLK